MINVPDEGIPDQPVSPEETLQPGSPNASVAAGARSRKRTKTGCLTCRKRRIKCGEERPICANCVKSKRSCEGYAPRLTFKDPVGAYPQGWPVRGYHLPPGTDSRYLQNPGAGNVHSQFPLIAPRPQPNQEYYGNMRSSSEAYTSPTGVSTYNQVLPTNPTFFGVQTQQQSHSLDASSSQSYNLAEIPYQQMTDAHRSSDAQWRPNRSQQNMPMDQTSVTPLPAQGVQSPAQAQPQCLHTASVIDPTYNLKRSGAPVYNSSYIPVASHSGEGYKTTNISGDHDPGIQIGTIHHTNLTTLTPDHEHQRFEYFQQHPAVAQLYEEDEYYDVESDEEMPDADNTNSRGLRKKQRDLNHVLVINGRGRNLRSVEAFLNQSNALANYAPRYTTSPLMDEATARIFCHFVTATGPLMSAYGRHPVNPALLFSGAAVPKSQQALWTYTIPMMAISNQALLHAILAVSSLNIARLQQAPLTVPIKHYQFALRRVAKAVATPGKRTAMATVAATILLSQFEILSAEHSKWHSHLAGARQLLTEIDFTHWTDRIHAERKRRATAASVNGLETENVSSQDLETFPWIPSPGSSDEEILNKIAGTRIKRESHDQTPKSRLSQSTRPIAEKEMDDFQTYRDLFWMYTKIDNIQSFVSGRRLLLPLDRWTFCPPRAPMNRFDAVYGTLDHVGILLGRVADFAGKDVFRKRQAVKAGGGIWRPSASMFAVLGRITGQRPPGVSVPHQSSGQVPSPPNTGSMPSTPGQAPPGSNAKQQQNPAMTAPTFNGLLPGPEQAASMPTAFTQAPKDILYQDTHVDLDVELKEATAVAEDEWNDIQQAFDVFERALGPSFSPLPTDSGLNIDTAFGPALQYRTFQIATCWLLFYMAKIIAIRTHPAMPPASMVAAGVAAGRTAQFCNLIGRINFGLRTPAANQPLNPIFGGAITEMMLPMFVAGVQYTDNAQRVATIERLQFIADRIGHDSAALIAAGLEKTWIKMHEAGRGPRYSPSVRVQDEYGRDLTQYERNQSSHSQGDLRVPRGPARDLAGRETSKNRSRGAVILQPDTRSFAAGVMGLEESFKSLNVDDIRKP